MRIVKRVLIGVGYVVWFSGIFYVIFINFILPANLSTDIEVIKSLMLAFMMASFLPGMICIEFNYICKLEERVHELESIIFPE